MTRALIIGGGHSRTICRALALASVGIAVATEAETSIAVCPTGYEDWPIYKAPSIEPLKNDETWRGRGKRRKPMCK